MQITIQVFGRRKSDKLDTIMEKINESYNAFGGEGTVKYNHPINTITMEDLDKKEWEEKKEEVFKMLKEEYGKLFSDVSFEVTIV